MIRSRDLAERSNGFSSSRVIRSTFHIGVALAVCFFGGVILGQKTDRSGPNYDWPKDDASLSRMVTAGSIEAKRDALFEIRNRESSAASRIAIPALNDRNNIVRATAAASVIFLPKDEAASLLLPLLSDKSPFVRREAAYALGKVGSSSATQAIVLLMRRDKDFEVKTAAAVALGEAGDPSALAPLIDVLKKKPKESEEFLRRSASRSIGQIAQINRTGKRLVTTPHSFLPEKFKESNTPSAEMPSQLVSVFRPAIAVLSSVLQSAEESDDTRREAAFSLGAIGDPAAFSALESSLGSPDYYLAEIAREAILKFGVQR